MLRKLSNTFRNKSSLTIYKSFIRSCLDYDDLVYDQPYKCVGGTPEGFCGGHEKF